MTTFEPRWNLRGLRAVNLLPTLIRWGICFALLACCGCAALQSQSENPGRNSLSTKGDPRELAVLYDQQGDDGRARAAYEQALAVQPDDADLLNDFGVFHLNREQWVAAEPWFRRALAVQPGHQRATVNLAMSLAMQSRLNESYEAFSRIVGPAAAYSNIGVLLTRQGRLDEAREHFRRALALDRGLQPAGEFLSRLEPSTPPVLPPARIDATWDANVAAQRPLIQAEGPTR